VAVVLGARWVAGVFVGCLAACADDGQAPPPDGGFKPTGATVLSVGSPAKDEDPSVVRARDGRLYVAWFSEQTGNPEIHITRTDDGLAWSPPVRVTNDGGGDFNPSLYQDAQGTFHLAWFRWTALYRGHIWYNTSSDGVSWSSAAEVQVTTTPDVDDWVPTLTQATDGTLLVYFVSDKRDSTNPTNEIYVAAKRPGEIDWDAAVPAAGINSTTEHDHLPFAARTGAGITLVWVRYDTTQATPWLNAKSDVYYATSADGLAWSVPARITNDVGNVVNLFPGLYASLGGTWWLVWVSTRQGAATVFELPLANAGQYPTGIVADPWMTGYSPRLAATPTPGIYIGLWVQGPDGAQDVYYRFVAR
jgi:hypothetical protein